MPLAAVVAVWLAVAGTAGRRAKTTLLADLLRLADERDLPLVVTWLTGATKQRRTGLGWASLRDLPPPATVGSLTVLQVDAALQRAADAAGAGAQAARQRVLVELLAAATGDEQRFLVALLSGELRQGAGGGVLLDAVAQSAGIASDQVRRAVMLTGDLAAVAAAARAGGVAAVAGFGLQVGRALAPMLASAAPQVEEALERTGPAAVEWKLDGVRVQVHKDGDDVAVFTRSLDEVTDRLPDVVAAARRLRAGTAVVDGEAIALRPDGRPEPFQLTASRAARRDLAAADEVPLSTLLFDLLHLDGVDLLDRPARTRRAALEAVAPAQLLVPRLVPTDIAAADAFARDALARGHEGVVVKALDAPYAMGRRGAAWVKVKPRLTLDLVVLAVERGSGRRQGLLSNLHLGARDPAGRFGVPGGFVMLGKTFKGLTDAMLTWQTQRLSELATDIGPWVVRVRPELVVEIAFDGVQTSSRYPAGVALRFARVVAHRPDKPADQADTVDAVLALRP